MKLSICYVLLIQRHVKLTLKYNTRPFSILKKRRNSKFDSELNPSVIMHVGTIRYLALWQDQASFDKFDFSGFSQYTSNDATANIGIDTLKVIRA